MLQQGPLLLLLLTVAEAGPWRVGNPFVSRRRGSRDSAHELAMASSLITEGTIVLSPISNTDPCTRLLNESCFGQCLGALKVRQEGPLHNTTSEAASLGFMTDKNCTCLPGYGRYDEANQTATWVTREDYHGRLVPRVLDVAVVPAEGIIVVQHREQPVLRHCFFMYEVLSGSVMGLGAGDDPASPVEPSAQVLPVWGAIVAAMGGVLLCAVSAMLIFRRRAVSARAATRRDVEEEAAAEAPSLRDPLLDD